MKKFVLILAGVAAIGLSQAFGQGTVNFTNAGNWYGMILNRPIRMTWGALWDIDAGAYWVNLLWGPDANSVSTPVTASPISIGANGFFFGGPQTIPGAAIGAQPYFKVQVWDKTGGTSWRAFMESGLWLPAGESATFQITQPLGDPARGSPPPPPLFGFPDLHISYVPEPTTWALLALGGLALLIRRGKGR